MNTYLVYVLDNSAQFEPKVIITYAQGAKYGDAWQAARASLSNTNLEGATTPPVLYDDAECKVPTKIGHGKHLTVAKVIDIRPRNVKLDKAALTGILADASASAEDKLAALTKALGGAPAPTPTPAADKNPKPTGKGGEQRQQPAA